MIKDQKCGDCIHFLINPKNDDQGQCRCNPPQLVVLHGEQEAPNYRQDKGGGIIIEQNTKRPTNQIQSMFPPMKTDDLGCGHYLDENGF